MAIYYSLSTEGFYDTAMDYSSLPDDIIEITPEEHKYFLNEIYTNNMKLIVRDGKPVLTQRTYTVTWDDVKIRRNALLQSSDYTQTLDWPGDKAAWAAYRQDLRDIPQTFANPEDVIWPSIPGS